MLNRVQLIGRLGQDPKQFGDESKATTFSLATTEAWKNKAGEKIVQTEWHEVVAFGYPGNFANKYLSKGDLVYIEGSLQRQQWEDKNGNNRHSWKIKAQKVQGLGDRKEEQLKDPSAPTKDEIRDEPNYQTGDIPF